MLIARLLVAVTGLGMALVLAVVMLIYGVYIPDNPELAQQMKTLLLTTLIFTLLGGSAATSARGTVRQWKSQRVWDFFLLAMLPASSALLWQIYGS